MKIEKDTYVLLYSFSQQCFHVEELKDTLRISMGQFLRNDSSGYTPLVFSEDKEAIYEISQAMKIRDNWDKPFTREEVRHVAEAMEAHKSKLIGL